MNSCTGPVVNQLKEIMQKQLKQIILYFTDCVASWRGRYGCSSPSTKLLHGTYPSSFFLIGCLSGLLSSLIRSEFILTSFKIAKKFSWQHNLSYLRKLKLIILYFRKSSVRNNFSHWSLVSKCACCWQKFSRFIYACRFLVRFRLTFLLRFYRRVFTPMAS